MKVIAGDKNNYKTNRRYMGRRGGTEYFESMILNVYGNDEALNSILEELEYVSGIEVLSRYDSEDGKGVLVIQVLRYAKQAIIKLAKKHELVVN